ncbi:MAG: hypothetical protein WCI00_09645 [bacterium]
MIQLIDKSLRILTSLHRNNANILIPPINTARNTLESSPQIHPYPIIVSKISPSLT